MQFSGSSEWSQSGVNEYAAESLVVDRAESGFSMRFFNCGRDYSVVLKPSENPGVVVGTWSIRGQLQAQTGHCVVRVFESVNGELILDGRWDEGGRRYQWLTKLKPA